MWGIVSGGVVTQILDAPVDFFIGSNHYPAQVFSVWTEQQLNAIGVYSAIYSDAAPTRFHAAGNPIGNLSGNIVNITRTWNAATLAQAQALAYNIVDIARQNACSAGTLISGVSVATDIYSIMLIIGYYINAVQNASFTAIWPTGKGTTITLTNAQIKNFAPQVLSFLQTQFSTQQTRNAAIAAATSVAAIETLLQGYGL